MGSEELVEKVVEALTQARLDQGISQRELSRKTGLSNGGIHHMEKGHVTPTLFFLATIAQALGIRIGPLITGAEEGKGLKELMEVVSSKRENS